MKKVVAIAVGLVLVAGIALVVGIGRQASAPEDESGKRIGPGDTAGVDHKDTSAAMEPAGSGDGSKNEVAQPEPEQPDAADNAAKDVPVAPAKPVQISLPDELAVLLDTKATIAQKLAALDAFGRTLDASDAPLMLQLLQMEELSETVRNEVANVMQKQDAEAFVPLLGEMARDPEQSELWREYCLQHLGMSYQRTRDDAALESVRWAMTQGDTPKVKAGGLYTLALTARETGALDVEKLDTAIKTFLQPSQPEAQRIAAIQAAALLKQPEHLDSIIEIARDAQQPMSLGTAAINALAEFPGEEAARQTATELSRSESSRVRRLAGRVAKRLSPTQP